MPPGGDRDRRELDVLLKRGPAFLIYKGLQDPAAERDYARAHEIAKPLGDDEALFKAIWGLWLCSNLSRRTAPARDRAEELVALAQRSGDELLILEAIHCRWSTAFFRGDVPRSLTDSHEGIRHYDPDRHGRLAAEFGGHDPGVCANTVTGLALAQMGRMTEATATVERGLSLAKSLNHPNSLAFGCMNAMTAYQIIGDRPARPAAARHKRSRSRTGSICLRSGLSRSLWPDGRGLTARDWLTDVAPWKRSLRERR